MTEDGLRASIDVLERRQEELESQLALAESQLVLVEFQLTVGKSLVIDLIKQHFERMEDFDAQLVRVRDWCNYQEKT